jgi:short-subunit dehydrogenase
MSTSLRIEAADRNVRVTALCPAAIDTPLLDRDNLPELPHISWHPNIRRYLARLVGSPYPAAKFAEQALDGVERNKAIVVIPARARLAWRLTRLAPQLVERLALKGVRAERAER